MSRWLFDELERAAEESRNTPAEYKPVVTVVKIGHVVPMSRELALDYGVIEPTAEDYARWAAAEAERNKWHRRIRRAYRMRVSIARHRIACWVAGYEIGED